MNGLARVSEKSGSTLGERANPGKHCLLRIMRTGETLFHQHLTGSLIHQGEIGERATDIETQPERRAHEQPRAGSSYVNQNRQKMRADSEKYFDVSRRQNVCGAMLEWWRTAGAGVRYGVDDASKSAAAGRADHRARAPNYELINYHDFEALDASIVRTLILRTPLLTVLFARAREGLARV
jgi:hypothetical protein